jgi:hypothetical protein
VNNGPASDNHVHVRSIPCDESHVHGNGGFVRVFYVYGILLSVYRGDPDEVGSCDGRVSHLELGGRD